MHKAIRHTCVGDVGSTAGVVSTRFAVALWRRWAGGAMSGAYAPHPGRASAPLRFPAARGAVVHLGSFCAGCASRDAGDLFQVRTRDRAASNANGTRPRWCAALVTLLQRFTGGDIPYSGTCRHECRGKTLDLASCHSWAHRGIRRAVGTTDGAAS